MPISPVPSAPRLSEMLVDLTEQARADFAATVAEFGLPVSRAGSALHNKIANALADNYILLPERLLGRDGQGHIGRRSTC